MEGTKRWQRLNSLIALVTLCLMWLFIICLFRVIVSLEMRGVKSPKEASNSTWLTHISSRIWKVCCSKFKCCKQHVFFFWRGGIPCPLFLLSNIPTFVCRMCGVIDGLPYCNIKRKERKTIGIDLSWIHIHYVLYKISSGIGKEFQLLAIVWALILVIVVVCLLKQSFTTE